jgi:RHS repeat-associated protein
VSVEHGNITSIVDGVNGNENRTLTYDARDRMSGAVAPNIYGQEVTEYDVLDNVRRLAGVPNGSGGYGQDYRYQYTASQRLDRIDDPQGALQWDFEHNGFGETTARSGHSRNWYYQWNAAGRMTRADRYYAGNTWETYVYDAHGHRTRSSRHDGSTRYQVYSRAGQLLYTEDTKDNQRIDYIHLGGKLIAQRSRPLNTSTATTTYHHTDHIQSATIETNTAGTQTQRTVRTPYGSPYNGIYREGPGYAGHVTDTQTNLTYMQQRYYDPVALRFLSPDPVDVSASDGGNFNRYWYANNNPYRYRDPDGRQTSCPDMECNRERQRQRDRQRDAPFTGGRVGRTQDSEPQIPLAGNLVELVENTYERVIRRTSFTASGGVAGGVGIDGVATKTTRPWQQDRVGAYGVLGLGGYVGATANYRLFSWGDKAGTTGLRMKGNPFGYFRLRVGSGLSIGIITRFNDHGGGSFSVSFGGGIGAQAIVKPPATLGWEEEL